MRKQAGLGGKFARVRGWILCAFLLWTPEVGGSHLRIAIYNVENYLSQHRWVEGRFRWDYPKPEPEKEALRENLLAVMPDIVLLQEFGEDAYLRELQEDLAALGLDYPHRFVGLAHDEVRQLAVLSRIAWKEVRIHDDLDFPYLEEGRISPKRGVLEVVFEGERGRLVLYNLHLKSRLTEHPEDYQAAERRRREARVIRDRIQERYPVEEGHLVLVAGDFNDHPGSPAVRHFLQRSGTTLAVRVPATDTRGETWTHHFARQSSYSTIDHILVSPELWPLVLGERARIYDRQPQSGVASDHRMVYLDIKW